MRIALVSEHASPLAVLGGTDAGGQNVHVAALASTLADLGHDVRVYTRRDDPGLPERVTLVDGTQVVHVPAGPPDPVPRDELLPYMPEFAEWMADDWRTHGAPHVVHAHFWMSGLAALQAANGELPVAVTFHALGSVKRRHQRSADTSPPTRVASEATIGRRADAIVATCSDEVRELARLGVPVSAVHVVPCGVDATLFHPGAFSPRVPPRLLKHRLVSVGRLVERKGIDVVVRALPALPDTELIVAGGPAAEDLMSDPEALRLMRVARENGVEDRVILIGRLAHEEIPGLMCSADLVIAPPWYEPFGIVPVEAAACGVPVVGSAVGGLIDTVADGETGRLVPPQDVDALAEATRLLLDDPERRAAYGRAARMRAVARYTWVRVGIRTQAVYQSLVNEARLTREVAG